MATKILFQGDSITDASRDYANIRNLGNGYPKFSAELIKQAYPDKEFDFFNLGISGNKAENLRDRWQKDCIDLQPDILSILIGVNDTWHYSETGSWLSNELFESYYREILTRTKKETNAKIIILEQFLLYTPDKAFFRDDLNPKIDISRALAREFADVFVPLDGIFAAASVKKEPTYWAADGVHPSEAGAKLIAEHYLKAIKEIL